MLRKYLKPISNRADWTETFTVVDSTGANVDLTSATIVFSIKKCPDDEDDDDLIQGTITNQAVGSFTVTFTRLQLQDLQGTYDVGCTYNIAGVTTQFMFGRLPIIDGSVPE